MSELSATKSGKNRLKMTDFVALNLAVARQELVRSVAKKYECLDPARAFA